VDAPAFSNEVDMLSCECSQMSKTSSNFSFDVIKSAKGNKKPGLFKRYKVRDAFTNYTTLDSFDLGSFQYATTGMPADGNIVGQMFVDYTVELTHAMAKDNTASENSHYVSNAGIDISHCLGTSGQTEAGSTFSVIPNGNVITLPPNIKAGRFMLVYMMFGSSTASVIGPAVSATTNCNASGAFNGLIYPGFATYSGTSNYIQTTYVFTVTGPSPQLTFGFSGAIPAAPGWADLYITALPYNLLVETYEQKFKSMEEQMKLLMSERMRFVEDSKEDFSSTPNTTTTSPYISLRRPVSMKYI